MVTNVQNKKRANNQNPKYIVKFVPVAHQLSYPIYMYGFDLDDLPHLGNGYLFFGYNRMGITSIHDKDYLQPGEMPIKQKIDQLLDQHNVKESINFVMMITSARYFNYVFNPVNFHYCFSENNKPAAIIAEVNNTYGERHPYILTQNTNTSPNWQCCIPVAFFSKTMTHWKSPRKIK